MQTSIEKGVVITKDKKTFAKLIDNYTDKKIEKNRLVKINQRYGKMYPIAENIATVNGKQVHIGYLPVIHEMSKVKGAQAKEIIGAALYKIEKDYTIFLVDDQDPNLKAVYKEYKETADAVARTLWNLQFDYQWTHVIATVLAGSFENTFGQTLGTWRRSLPRAI